MFIAIEGVIGVGKTSLARLLQIPFKSNILLEIFEENPFLSKFYEDRNRYAFQTQMFFLLSRYHQQRHGVPKLLEGKIPLISDYTFNKDALFAQITLVGDELEMYAQLHSVLAEKIPVPDLVVYLRASTDILMKRIALRDRSYERSMDRAYIDSVNKAYDGFFIKNNESSHILIIDSDNLDFVHNEDDFHFIESNIRQELQLPPFQPKLPINK